MVPILFKSSGGVDDDTVKLRWILRKRERSGGGSGGSGGGGSGGCEVVTYVAVDGHGWHPVLGSQPDLSTKGVSVNVDLSTVQDGTYHVNVAASDAAGNVGPSTVSNDFELSTRTAPDTNITLHPASITAHYWLRERPFEFRLVSPDAKGVVFDWRLGEGDWEAEPACPEPTIIENEPCVKIILTNLPMVRTRFEARARFVDTTNSDDTPASRTFLVESCNDDRNKYADVGTYETGEDLACIDCPRQGADCTSVDATWSEVIAIPGWWTNGDDKDLYYRCPFTENCIGGTVADLKVRRTRGRGKGGAGTTTSNTTTTASWAPAPAPSNDTNASLDGRSDDDGTTTLKSRCRIGAEGPVCANCASNFFKQGPICVPCADEEAATSAVAIVVFIGVFGLFLLALLCQMRVSNSHKRWHKITANLALLAAAEKEHDRLVAEANDAQESLNAAEMKRTKQALHHSKKSLKRKRTAAASRHGNDSTSVVERTKRMAKITKRLKIIVGYFQLLSAAEASYAIPWPDALFQFFMLLLPINFDLVSVTGLDCISQYDWYSSFHVMAGAPLGVVLFVGIVHAIGRVYLQRTLGKHFTTAVRHQYADKAVQFILWCILLAYPPVSKKTLEFFQCSEEIVGVSYMQVDYRLQCYDERWMSYLPVVIGCVLSYPLGIPLYLGVKLWLNRNEIVSDDEITKFESRYSFFYSSYKDEAFMWDVIELVRKLLLTAVIILVKPGSDSQTIVGLLITLFFLFILLWWHPYKSKVDEYVAVASQLALTITMLFGTLLKTQILHKEEWNIHALGISLLIMNGAVVVFVVFTLILLCYQNVRSRREEQKKKVARTKSKFTRAFGNNNSTKVTPVGDEIKIEDGQGGGGDYYQVMKARTTTTGGGTNAEENAENDDGVRFWGSGSKNTSMSF